MTSSPDTRPQPRALENARGALPTGPPPAPESTGSPLAEVAPGPWDALGPAPHSPLRARAAERLFRHAVRDLPVRIAVAGGERLGAGGQDSPLMRIERPRAFFRRLGTDAKIGFGEAYMAGDWTSPEPADLLTPFAARVSTLVPRPLQALRRAVEPRKPSSERNTTSGARNNIHRHYDLSNEVFARFLDETMTYSGAPLRPGDTGLATAQLTKLDQMLDAAGVGAGTRMLEIGTGWGSLAIRAARRGAEVTTLTISEQQYDYTREQVAAAGLADRVDVQLRDYRHARPPHGRDGYDAVVSIEMIEAVGAEFWPTFFRTVDRLLVEGGRAAVQAITMPHDRLLATRESYTWIHKYIFPGGLTPSMTAIERATAAHTGLNLEHRHAFGQGYAETLRRWRTRFDERWPEIADLGFSELFRRMWEFYLAYCEAGFRSGYLNVWQLGFRKPERN